MDKKTKDILSHGLKCLILGIIIGASAVILFQQIVIIITHNP